MRAWKPVGLPESAVMSGEGDVRVHAGRPAGSPESAVTSGEVQNGVFFYFHERKKEIAQSTKLMNIQVN